MPGTSRGKQGKQGKAGTSRDKAGTSRDKAGTSMDMQGQARTIRDSPFLIVLVCPCLTLLVSTFAISAFLPLKMNITVST